MRGTAAAAAGRGQRDARWVARLRRSSSGERVQARESEKEGGVGVGASSPCCEGRGSVVIGRETVETEIDGGRSFKSAAMAAALSS